MTPDLITEAMRLASLLATARCQRLVTNNRNGGLAAIQVADELVRRRTIDLRTYLETFQCHESSSALSTSSAS
jgi:hypothetical protein